MARARNIKPAFFMNEILVGLPFEYRLLFIGLWTLCDREGRMEDRPVKVKMELFPADNVDVNAGLQALHDNGFILRYEVDGKRYLQVLTWGKHQNPHVKEAKSTIPAPGEHGASTVQEPEVPERAGLIPSSLIPDSGFLIPDSTPDTHTTTDPTLGANPPALVCAGQPEPTATGQAAAALQRAGLRITSIDPRLIEAIAEGVTTEHLLEVHRAYPDKPAAYVVATARRLHAEGGTTTSTGATHAASPHRRQRGESLTAHAERINRDLDERERRERREQLTVIDGTATRAG